MILRNYYDIDYFGTNVVAGSYPGVLNTPGVAGAMVMFIQDSPVLRIAPFSRVEYLVTYTLTPTGGWSGTSEAVSQTLRCREGQPVYIPLREVLAAMYRPRFAPGTGFIVPKMTATLTLEAADMEGAALARAQNYTLDVYPGTAVQVPANPGVAAWWPSVARTYGAYRHYFTVASPVRQEVVVLVTGITGQGGTAEREYEYTGQGGGCILALDISCKAVHVEDVFPGQECRIERLACVGDKVLVHWFAPLAGGYKSAWFDVAGFDTSVEAADAVVRDARALLKRGTAGWRLRLDCPTLRDCGYYGDILTASEVWVQDFMKLGVTPTETAVAARVANGSLPARRQGGVLELTLTTNNFNYL